MNSVTEPEPLPMVVQLDAADRRFACAPATEWSAIPGRRAGRSASPLKKCFVLSRRGEEEPIGLLLVGQVVFKGDRLDADLLEDGVKRLGER
jgi:hypothetical protein